MKYIDEFRDHKMAETLANAIRKSVLPTRAYKIMEFCGGHTHAIFRYGVRHFMPENFDFVHGAGCPVCVLPTGRIDNAIQLALNKEIIFCTYADMLRVPATRRNSLMKAKAQGADVRMVYSTQNALKIAEENPHRQIVFFAIGFETTTPATAVAILQAKKAQLKNFSVFCNHVLTPSAIRAILEAPNENKTQAVHIDGFLGPSHVSTVIGSAPYEAVAQEYQKPVVIAGFEPLDIMQSTLMLIKQINQGRFEVENEYTRAVSPGGNSKAQALVHEVMEVRAEFEWRGLGMLPESALKIKPGFREFDAEYRFDIPLLVATDLKGCECPSVLRGSKKPTDCKLFGTVCVPENPMGSCMVSSEGACAAYWSYGRHVERKRPKSTVGNTPDRRAV